MRPVYESNVRFKSGKIRLFGDFLNCPQLANSQKKRHYAKSIRDFKFGNGSISDLYNPVFTSLSMCIKFFSPSNTISNTSS